MTTSGISPQFCHGILSPLNGTPQSDSDTGEEAWNWDRITREMKLGKFSQRTSQVPQECFVSLGSSES